MHDSKEEGEKHHEEVLISMKKFDYCYHLYLLLSLELEDTPCHDG
jgi:hypothetical protein